MTSTFVYHFSEDPTIEIFHPLSVEPVGDLLTRHAEAGIELRVTPSLWLLADAIPNTGLAFSMVRLRNALPRT